MIPLWIKLAYTLLVVVTVAVYAVKWGPGNFLWFSDIALIGTVPALWLESGLLASMMTLAILLPEILWNLSFFVQLATRRRVSGLTDYMFDRSKPLYLRALSLFHVFLPVLLVWMISRLGYESRALAAQTILAWVVLPLSYSLTKPEENVNWVHGFNNRLLRGIHPIAYLGLLMVGFPVLIYLPTHFLLMTMFN
ncbi:MAG: membrane-associated protein [Betaproteobacteria bacterium]